MSFEIFNYCGRAEISILEFEEECFFLRVKQLAFLV